MTSFMLSSGTKTGSAIESMMHFWMLPAQFGLGLMESAFTSMMSALPVPAPEQGAPRTDEKRQEIAREAEEQAAHIDDGRGDTIPTVAALIA